MAGQGSPHPRRAPVCQRRSGVASCWRWVRWAGRSEEQVRDCEPVAAGSGREDAPPSAAAALTVQRWPGRGSAGGQVVVQGLVYDVGEASLQAADGLAAALSFGAFALVVGAAFGVGADLGDRDRGEHPVELPVARAVEPMAGGAPKGSGDAGGGEGVARAVAADVGDPAQDRGGADRSEARSAGCAALRSRGDVPRFLWETPAVTRTAALDETTPVVVERVRPSTRVPRTTRRRGPEAGTRRRPAAAEDRRGRRRPTARPAVGRFAVFRTVHRFAV